jgi:hypothetical protein
MTATAAAEKHAGRPSELGRYEIAEGSRILVGQRVDGEVRVTDRPFPLARAGRTYLGERDIRSFEELAALIADYLDQAERRGDCPMRVGAITTGETSRIAEALS